MKKVLSLILALALCLSFGACSGETEQPEVNKPATTPPPAIGTPVEMAEQVLYDAGGIVITATRLAFDKKSEDICAKFFYEVANNTDSDIQVSQLTFDVNGLSTHTPARVDVYPKGKTVEDAVTINQNCAQWNDIRVMKEIAFSLKIEACHENPDVKDSYLVDEVLVANTGRLTATTKYAETYPDHRQAKDTDGAVLFQNEQIALIFTEVYTTTAPSLKNLNATMYCQNTYEFPVHMEFTVQKINGKAISPQNNLVKFPLQSEGFRNWFEGNIDADKIDSMEFTYRVTNALTGEVLLESNTPRILTFRS